jgi:4-hydroxy-4-methyl-2-oxoglutarate aldolase
MEELLARWEKIPVAVAADVGGGVCTIDPAIRPLRPAGQQPQLFGLAVTAVCLPPDFGAVLRALDVIKAGEVLVIDGLGNPDHAMIGSILGGHLHRKGCAGVVCDGAIRDVAELVRLDSFSVYCRSICARGPTASTGGLVNTPAMIGGVRVAAGDLILGDDDGLCAVSPELLRVLIDAAEDKLKLESQWIGKFKSGMTAGEIFRLG